VAYAVADELNLGQLKDALEKQGLYDLCEMPVGKSRNCLVNVKKSISWPLFIILLLGGTHTQYEIK
jgi:hypothetical protein